MSARQVPFSKQPIGWCVREGLQLAGALIFLLAAPANTVAAADPQWTVVGRQGLVQIVIVPVERATDQSAYESQIERLCPPERTCFLNFYTNSTGVAPRMPLPDVIADEAVATFRRSMKNGVELFQWSCKLKISAANCF